MVELRPNISGYYKGLCILQRFRSSKSSQKTSLDSDPWKNTFDQEIKFPKLKEDAQNIRLNFPEYGENS